MSDETYPSTTSRSDEPGMPAPSGPALAVVLECDRLDAGGSAADLREIDRVTIGRGSVPGVVWKKTGPRMLRLELPDRKVSTEHAVLERGPSFVLRDVGSTNGSFFAAERITQIEVEPGNILRLGHTFLTLVADPPASLEKARDAWPFATLHGPLRRAMDRLERIAPTHISLLILGETGTGKEVLARAVHARSGRPGRFVAVNCGALPSELVEALFFGHKRGAFSGSVRDELGFVREADGGTLFLDEIGDLPPMAQAALLRVLQEQEVTPVGASQPVRVDVRVLAATHRPLDAMIDAGRFRADLHSRLTGFVFHLPPLRERRCDVGFVVAHALRDRPRPLRLHVDAAQALLEHEYLYNIRELVQMIAASSALAEGDLVRRSDLPRTVDAKPAAAPPDAAPLGLSEQEISLRNELIRRLDERGGNVTRVAEDMGKARQQIQRWLRRFGVSPKRS